MKESKKVVQSTKKNQEEIENLMDAVINENIEAFRKLAKQD
ncbi:hypothetical protein EV204_101307 [Tissierella praeacuta]|nr:hypothetical protein [Tissierella praeacuta]TCU79328.1 hypothetical protein EV204_101307 [Tissierella praeacuta]